MRLRVTGAWTTDYTPIYTFWPDVKYKTKINSGQVLDLTETNIIYHHHGYGLTRHPSTFCIRNKKVTLTFKAKSLRCDSLQTSWCLRIAIVVSRACHFGILLGKIMKLLWMWEYGHRMLPPNDGGGPSPAQPSPAQPPSIVKPRPGCGVVNRELRIPFEMYFHSLKSGAIAINGSVIIICSGAEEHSYRALL